jgi:hypothetical protein
VDLSDGRFAQDLQLGLTGRARDREKRLIHSLNTGAETTELRAVGFRTAPLIVEHKRSPLPVVRPIPCSLSLRER